MVLVVASLAIPAGLLALILTRPRDHAGAAAGAAATVTIPPTDTTKAKVGEPAPDFTLETTTGRTVTLSSLRGRPVVIAFFASWCHPCEEEMPVLQQLARADTGRLQVLGVSFQDLPSDTAGFVRRLGITFPALLEDPSGPVAQRYGVRGIPQTVFVDERGVVRGRVYGQTSRRALEPAIDDLLRGRDIRAV